MSEKAGTNKIEIFISSADGDRRSHRRRDVWKQLTDCLNALRAEGVIQGWTNRTVEAGAIESATIESLRQSEIVIFAIGQNYLDHPERYREVLNNLPGSGRYLVFSLLLYPGAWRNSPFAKFNLLPLNEAPVIEWGNVDDAFDEIKKAVKQARQAIYPEKSKPRQEIENEASQQQSRSSGQSDSTDLLKTVEDLPSVGESIEKSTC